MDNRAQLHERLRCELEDDDLAAAVAAGLSDGLVADLGHLCNGHFESSPTLSYRPSPRAEFDTVWAFAFGHRLTPGTAWPRSGQTPPMKSLLPGPTNIALAEAVIALTSRRAVPVVAQWEIAEVLHARGVDNVIAVDPDVAADGTVTYLSTSGVAEKGQRLVPDAGVRPGRVSVVAHHDHLARSVATARTSGLDAAAPHVQLPVDFDAGSAQRWTRNRRAWIATDLFARTRLDLDWTI